MIQEGIPLSSYTTIGLGGKARYFISCPSVDSLRSALTFARRQTLRTHILGGGSNVIFADQGFRGVVIKIDFTGVTFSEHAGDVLVGVAAGNDWDAFVQQCISMNLAGVECLSGIPGLAGATPIQNVGAYGQEVKETIVSVKAIDCQTLNVVEFSNDDCRFGYRQSRFKSDDAGRYVITDVLFRLRKNGRPVIRYAELQRSIAATTALDTLPDGEPALRVIRDAVLQLRRGKSMVLNPQDPHSRSVGSFFTNPIVSRGEFDELERRWNSLGKPGAIPSFPSGERVKIPAAWLVEQAGFPKGFRSGRVGVSQNHSLALVNYGGTTDELLNLALRIQDAVRTTFGITLEREPIVVPA